MTKFKKGRPITSIDDLMQQKFVFQYNKITHYGWFMSWQLMYAVREINMGHLYTAEYTDEYKQKLIEEWEQLKSQNGTKNIENDIRNEEMQ